MNDAAIVVPVKNEETTIQPLLESFEKLTLFPKEIIIVDGGSTDRTVEVINRYLEGKTFPYAVRVILLAYALPGRGRNEGIRKTDCPLIVCIDAGGVVDSNWLGELTAPFKRNPKVDLVIGRCETNASNSFEQVSFFLFLQNIRRKSVIYSGCVFLAFRRSLWEEVGGFPETLYPCEDKYFMVMARRKARRIEKAPSACVYWSPRQNPVSFMRQYLFYGRGDGRIGFASIYHGLRFLAYGTGMVFVLARGLPARFAGLALFFYLGEVSIRAFRKIRKGAVFLYVPFLVVVKDVSQMVGFLIGCLESFFNPTFRQMRRALGSRHADTPH